MSFLAFKHVRPIKSLTAIMLLVILPQLKGYPQTATDEEVKAVYVYNLVNFVEWPASTFKNISDPFVIGVVGPDNYFKILKELVKGETYKGRQIEVKKVHLDDDVDECKILYIDRNSTVIERWISRAKDKPILTIGDKEDFMRSGGIVRFFLEDSKVKIEINQELAAERNLLIRAKLLRLAKLYKR